MSKHYPDVWIKMVLDDKERGTTEHILAGWYGGYTGSDSWRASTPVIASVADIETGEIEFTTRSGSQYVCHIESQRTSAMTGAVLESYKRDAEDSKGVLTVTVETVEI